MNLSGWETEIQFAIVYSIFALSFFTPLSAGVLSVASIVSGAVGGFLFAGLAPSSLGMALLSLVVGGIGGGLLAAVLSYPLLRLSSHYLAFATIALILVANIVVLNATSLTGGVNGKIVPPILGWPYQLGALVVCCWVCWRMKASRIGLAAAVIREDPLTGGGIGISTLSVQRLHFIVGGVFGGFAGVLLASLLQYVDPSTYYSPLAFTCLAAVVLGSAYHWEGALIGAFVFTLLPYLLQSYLSPNVDQVADGAVIVAVVIFLPGGLFEVRRWLPVGALRRVRLPTATAPAAAVPAAADRLEDAADGTRSTVDSPEAGQPLPVVCLQEASEPEPGCGARRFDGGLPGTAIAVRTAGLTKVFGGLRAVDSMTLDVPAGSVFGIVGPNGAGKTTLINLLSGVIKADEGTATVLSQDVTGWPSHRIARLGLARTYQNIRLSPGLSTLDTVVSGAYSKRHSTIVGVIAAAPGERRERRVYAEQARELMAEVGIRTPPERLAQTLSYGEQRRVEIARALASRPSVLLLDEPTAGMNARESALLGDLIRNLASKGLTVVLVEHNIRLVAEYCDWAAVMHSGALLAEGEPAECLAREQVQRAYFGRRADAERIQSLRVVRFHTGG